MLVEIEICLPNLSLIACLINVVQFGQAQRVTVLPIPDREIDDYIDRGMELLAPAIRRVEHNVDLDDVR